MLACLIDYNLGRLFGHLNEHNLLENTWIIFTSDHGDMLGDHHMEPSTYTSKPPRMFPSYSLSWSALGS